MSRFVISLLLALGGGVAFAQQPSALPPAAFDLFAGILNFHNVAPLTFDQAVESDGDRLMLIVLGRVPANERGRLAALSRRILAEGGSVLIATDEPLRLTNFLPDGTSIAVTGDKIRCPLPDATWAANDLCPLLVPRAVNPARLLLAPDETALLFTGLDRIAANLPSRLTPPGDGTADWRPLAELPAGCRTLTRDESLPRSERLFAAAASGKPGEQITGKALLLADSGLLTNQMLAPFARLPENDNLVFADRVVRWMQGNPIRTRAVVVVDGTPLTRFDGVPLTIPPPIPPLPMPDPLDPEVQSKLTQAVNEALGKFERNDGFNRLILGSDESTRPRRLRQFLLGLAVAVGIFVMLLGINRIRKRMHQPESDLLSAERTGAKAAKAGRIDARREAMLHAGKATDAVAMFLREWFQAAVSANGAGAGEGGTMPQVIVVSGGRAKPLSDQIRILWEEARWSGTMPYGRWKELQPMMMEMIRRHQAGEWRFAAEGDS